jgi:Cu+-exporting ATPase
MAYDPVCLAFVDEENAKITSMHRGTKYYFCTGYCKKKFEENPKRYTRIPSDINLGGSDTSC